jgi:hypothetical protein
VSQLRESATPADSALQAGGDLRVLFHRLNNQLGIILACAELLELKARDDVGRTRAGEVVAKVLDAMGTAKAIRHQTDLL